MHSDDMPHASTTGKYLQKTRQCKDKVGFVYIRHKGCCSFLAEFLFPVGQFGLFEKWFLEKTPVEKMDYFM